MMWQDLVLAVGGFGFAVALLPSVLSKTNKPARLSCLMTGSILLAFCVVYLSFGLILGTISTLLTAVMWFILLFKRS